MTLLTDSPTNPDPQTGTRRLDLWRESSGGGTYGDQARGNAYSARHLSDDEHGCAEIGVYPIECDDGGYGVEEMTTIGSAVLEDGIWRPDDSADISYDWADVRVYETLEQAQHAADRLGQVDYSYCLYLRAK